MPRSGVTGVRLFGVAFARQGDLQRLPKETWVVRFRDLAAIVRHGAYARTPCTTDDLVLHRHVIDVAFLHGAVLPAPCGTAFRSEEHVRLWLEQNYIALSEGIHFVAGRCEARLHISPGAAELGETPAADPAVVAAECFRVLRRHAAAAVPVRDDDESVVLSGAFLLQQDRWADFAEQVQELARRHAALHFEQTGPWPPYDFVRLDFET